MWVGGNGKEVRCLLTKGRKEWSAFRLYIPRVPRHAIRTNTHAAKTLDRRQAVPGISSQLACYSVWNSKPVYIVLEADKICATALRRNGSSFRQTGWKIQVPYSTQQQESSFPPPGRQHGPFFLSSFLMATPTRPMHMTYWGEAFWVAHGRSSVRMCKWRTCMYTRVISVGRKRNRRDATWKVSDDMWDERRCRCRCYYSTLWMVETCNTIIAAASW